MVAPNLLWCEGVHGRPLMSRRKATRLVILGGALLAVAGGAWLGWRLIGRPGDVAPPVDPARSDAPVPKYPGREADRQEAGITAITYSPDGKTLATGGSDGTILLSNAETGAAKLLLQVDDVAERREALVRQQPAELKRPLLELEEGPVHAVAFSPDGRLLAVGSGNWQKAGAVRHVEHPVGRLTVWNAATGQRVATIEGLTSNVTAVAFHPDGGSLAFAGGTEVSVWDVSSRAVTTTLRAPGAGDISSLAYSPDGAALAAGPGPAVTVWNLADGTSATKRLPAVVEGKWAGGVVFGRDGKLTTEAARWEAANRKQLALPPTVRAAAISPDGKRVAWVDEERWDDDIDGFPWDTPRLRVWETEDLGREVTWEGNLKRLTESKHRATRLEAIRWLKEHSAHPDAASALPALEDRVRHDPDWRAREKAVTRVIAMLTLDLLPPPLRGLGPVRPVRPLPLVVLQAFRDQERCVRCAARFLPSGVECAKYPPGAVEDLLKSAEFPVSYETRAEALRRLEAIAKDDPRALRAITAALTDKHPEVRKAASLAHAGITGKLDVSLPYLIRFTTHPETEWLIDPTAGPDEEGITPEQQRRKRNHWTDRAREVMAGMCSEKPAEVAAVLMKLLDDPSAAMRRDVAATIARAEAIKDLKLKVLPELKKLGVAEKLRALSAGDPDPSAREAAREALTHLTSK
jgi:hypothetical protein